MFHLMQSRRGYSTIPAFHQLQLYAIKTYRCDHCLPRIFQAVLSILLGRFVVWHCSKTDALYVRSRLRLQNCMRHLLNHLVNRKRHYAILRLCLLGVAFTRVSQCSEFLWQSGTRSIACENDTVFPSA